MNFTSRGKGKTNHTMPENILFFKINLKAILFKCCVEFNGFLILKASLA